MMRRNCLIVLTLVCVALVGFALSRVHGTMSSSEELSLQLESTGLLGRSIVGVVHNPYDYAVQDVTVRFAVYNDADVQTGFLQAKVKYLEPKQTWSFDLPLASSEVDHFNLSTLTARR